MPWRWRPIWLAWLHHEPIHCYPMPGPIFAMFLLLTQQHPDRGAQHHPSKRCASGRRWATATPAGTVNIKFTANFHEANMHKSDTNPGPSVSELISEKIAGLGDWRRDTLSRMRALIHEAAPDVVEEWKWMGTPVWSLSGILCTGETYKDKMKLTFAKGAGLADPQRLFNASLDGNVRRAIDIAAGEVVDASAFKALIGEAVALNRSAKSVRTKKSKV